MTAIAELHDAAAGRWVRFSNAETVLQTHDPQEIPALIQEVAARNRDEGLHAVGFLSYEAAAGLNPEQRTRPAGWLPLCWFALFRGAETVDPPEPPALLPELRWEPSIDEETYRARLNRIRRHIGDGETYQVNFSFRLRARLADELANRPRPLFASMLAQQPDGYGAFIETANWAICCASHELFFERQGNRVISRPMKGTVRRGCTPAEDAELARWLGNSQKNRAENLMIADMVRNDLGRIASIGSVRTEQLFRLEPYPTLWQMTSTITANSDRSLLDLLRATFPAASITGAPKRHTMSLIADLEDEPRQIYTGSIGYLRPDGSAQFNVAIRTALVSKTSNVAEYGVGGGIVWDSDPEEEYQECLTKARIVQPEPPAFDLLETLRWTPENGYVLLPEHLARLGRAASFFRRPFELDNAQRYLQRFAETLPQEPHRVRLLIDPNGGIGLSAAPLLPLPQPYRLGLAPAPADLQNNPYVLHKTTRREVYEAARRSVAGVDDVLLWNRSGEVTESTIANLFLDLHGTLVTPPLSSGLLPGVYRQWMLQTGQAVEKALRLEDLEHADAVYLGNSVRGLWRVELVPPATNPGSC